MLVSAALCFTSTHYVSCRLKWLLAKIENSLDTYWALTAMRVLSSWTAAISICSRWTICARCQRSNSTLLQTTVNSDSVCTLVVVVFLWTCCIMTCVRQILLLVYTVYIHWLIGVTVLLYYVYLHVYSWNNRLSKPCGCLCYKYILILIGDIN